MPAARAMWLSLIACFAGLGTLRAQEAFPAPCCREQALEVADRYRVEGLDDRRFTYERYWETVDPITRSDRLRVTPLGESVEGREIRAVTFGAGDLTVLLWSQMHGDESTATMSLADLMSWVADSPPDDPLRGLLEERLTVVLVPMLNPDGAERFRRENAYGVDINRDARRTATPEGRMLKGVREVEQAVVEADACDCRSI